MFKNYPNFLFIKLSEFLKPNEYLQFCSVINIPIPIFMKYRNKLYQDYNLDNYMKSVIFHNIKNKIKDEIYHTKLLDYLLENENTNMLDNNEYFNNEYFLWCIDKKLYPIVEFFLKNKIILHHNYYFNLDITLLKMFKKYNCIPHNIKEVLKCMIVNENKECIDFILNNYIRRLDESYLNYCLLYNKFKLFEYLLNYVDEIRDSRIINGIICYNKIKLLNKTINRLKIIYPENYREVLYKLTHNFNIENNKKNSYNAIKILIQNNVLNPYIIHHCVIKNYYNFVKLFYKYNIIFPEKCIFSAFRLGYYNILNLLLKSRKNRGLDLDIISIKIAIGLAIENNFTKCVKVFNNEIF